MIPFPQLASELAIGLGAALFGANALVLFRARFARPPETGRPAGPPSTAKVVVNMVVGAVVALVGLASLLGTR